MSTFTDSLYRILYQFAYPVMKLYWHFFKQATHGAQVAVWVDNSVLLIRNSYRSEYCFPGGHINQNETALQAAVRELREETGIHVNAKQLQQIKKITFQRNGVTCTDRIFKCQLNTIPNIKIDNREVVEAFFVSIPDCNALSLQNSVYKILSFNQFTPSHQSIR